MQLTLNNIEWYKEQHSVCDSGCHWRSCRWIALRNLSIQILMLCLKLPIYKLVKMLNRLDFVTKRSREFKSDQNCDIVWISSKCTCPTLFGYTLNIQLYALIG